MADSTDVKNRHVPFYDEIDTRHVQVTCNCRWSAVGTVSPNTDDGHPQWAAERLHDAHWARVVAQPIADRVYAEQVPVRDKTGRISGGD